MTHLIKSVLIFILLGSVFCFSALAASLKVQINKELFLAAETNGHADAETSVLLLHQCNRSQEMWTPVVQKLNKKGISTMTVDFRGYGQSKMAGFDVNLSDAAYDKATIYIQQDIHLIYQSWLKNTPQVTKRAVVGASCGGGAASILASQYNEIKALLLFSPSLRPYWFATKNWPSLQKRNGLPVLAIASLKDKNALNAINKVVAGSESPLTQKVIYNGRNHGEPLFELDPNLATKMAVWIEQALK